MTNIQYFQHKLVRRRHELVSMIEQLEDKLDDPKPTDIEDRATESEDDEVMELQVKVEYQELKAIDAALSRIENDAYGICLICEEDISKERLEAVPHATLCRNCMNNQF